MSDDLAAALAAIRENLDVLLSRSGARPRFMTISSAAAYSDLSADSLRRLIERGDLTAHRPVRGRILIDREQLDAVVLGSTARPRVGRGIRTGGASV